MSFGPERQQRIRELREYPQMLIAAKDLNYVMRNAYSVRCDHVTRNTQHAICLAVNAALYKCPVFVEISENGPIVWQHAAGALGCCEADIAKQRESDRSGRYQPSPSRFARSEAR